jgi:hypothetical protein
MFRLSELTLARSGNSCGADSGDGVPFGIFTPIIKGWSGPELSLTCWQGDFADDLSEGEIRTLVQPEASSHSPRQTLSSELASDKLY